MLIRPKPALPVAGLSTLCLLLGTWWALSLWPSQNPAAAEETVHEIAGMEIASAGVSGADIFSDGFETSDTSRWSVTVAPVYAQFLQPLSGPTQETEPKISVDVWTPTGVGVDFATFELQSNGGPLAA
ncbi:MAG: hypothetical protein MPN21_11060, partial [Thermoanaerobaculia bacterium]|nr:hypothetical protein [Thermoanaerobaculia bacterium]